MGVAISDTKIVQDHSYGTIEEEGEGNSKLPLIIMGVVIILLAAALVYVYETSGSNNNAATITSLKANIISLQAEIAKLKGQSNASVTTTVSAPTTTSLNLEYNKSNVLLSSYYHFFGYDGYSIPYGISGVPSDGPLNLTFGPYVQSGYLNITYFTAPSYPITLKVYKNGGTTQATTKPQQSSYLVSIPPDQVDLLSFSAVPKMPYNAINNSFYAQITVVWVPLG